MRDFDLLVAGDCNPDLVLAGSSLRPQFGQGETWVDEAQLVVGGSSSITACGAARLGLHTAIAGIVGDDLFGAFMRERLDAAGVVTEALAVDRSRPTGLSTVLVEPDDRATMTFPGTIGVMTAADVPDALLERSSHVHTGGFFLQGGGDELGDILRRARRAGATTSLDPGADPDGLWDGGIRDLLGDIDYLMPNAAEACALAGTSDLEQAARTLAAAGPTLVVKCGADGVLAVSGDTVVRAPALSVGVTDTIGAGDSTNAGWLAGILQGWELGQAARLAAVCGSLSTRGRGGTAGQPTLDEAQGLL
jgi:sugar/nucleoside kinase (ribokinase family)